MMKCTDRHYRTLMRLMAPQIWLYTEMVTAQALHYGDKDALLAYGAHELPLALQVGGSDVDLMRRAAHLAQQHGFSEVNINIGCPSDRVQSGRFGACLMREPDLVAQLFTAMQTAVDIPVTVKTRVGVDEDYHSYAYFLHFMDTVAAAGCTVFIIHARKAWLNGLSPKENRTVPPLQYDWVHQLKIDRPELDVIINGGVDTLAAAQAQLTLMDGVMVGRAAYARPANFIDVAQQLFQQPSPMQQPKEVLQAYLPYVKDQLDQGERLHRLVRPILPLFHGQPRAKQWRRFLSEHAWRAGADYALLNTAVEILDCAMPVA